MKLEITFYFSESGSAIECQCMLNENILGVGVTKAEAKEDYIKKFNEWSVKVNEEARRILKKKGAVYTTKDLNFIEQLQ